jgi:hypothetical protein
MISDKKAMAADGLSRITVSVPKTIIDNAIRADSRACMISDAIRAGHAVNVDAAA